MSAPKMLNKAQSATRQLIGPRRPKNELKPENVLLEAEECSKWIRQHVPIKTTDWRDLRTVYAEHCRSYYTLAALSRRKALTNSVRERAMSQLFLLRSQLEQKIYQSLELVEDQESLWRAATSKSFFGVSAKQGVSIRYPLLSCVPTKHCGGRCYAHDGRDRELHLIFRGVLTYMVGKAYESGSKENRDMVISRLQQALDYGVSSALEDAIKSQNGGFPRAPRIRFSHIGEMTSTPEFCHVLAEQIHKRNPEIACVIYTRHPRASELNTDQLIVNFTLDPDSLSRQRIAPQRSRLVFSSWDGEISKIAEVNFLEHHVHSIKEAKQEDSYICPVTADHASHATCDMAHCDTCFKKPKVLSAKKNSGEEYAI